MESKLMDKTETWHRDYEIKGAIDRQAAALLIARETQREYKVLPRIEAVDLEAAVNGLVADGWHDIGVRGWVVDETDPSSIDPLMVLRRQYFTVEAWRITGGPAHDLLACLAAEKAEKVEKETPDA